MNDMQKVDLTEASLMKVIFEAANRSGIIPTEYKVLIAPSVVDEKFAGSSIIKPVEVQEKDKYATTDGVIVAVSPLAFSYASAEEWDAAGAQKPKPGDKVAFARYAGARRKGKDGKDYLIINDKDVVALIEE